MKSPLQILFTAGFIGCSTLATAQTYFPDSSFAGDGHVIVDLGSPDSNPEDILVQPDNKILVGGYNIQDSVFITMVRMSACGEPDMAFGDSGKLRHRFNYRNLAMDLELQPDGKILAAGFEGSDVSSFIPAIHRFNPDGTPDLDFGDGGRKVQSFDGIADGVFYKSWTETDNSIIAAGTSTYNINGGTSGIGAMKFTSTGTLDLGFGFGGITMIPCTANSVDAVRLSDGKIRLVASINLGVENKILQAQLLPDGTLDINFGNNGTLQSPFNVTYARIKAELLPGDKVVAGVTSGTDFLIARFNANGTPDSSFGANGYAFVTTGDVNFFWNLELVEDKIIAAGRTGTGNFSGLIARLNSDGSLDSSFSDDGLMVVDVDAGTDYIKAVKAVQGDRIFYVSQAANYHIGRLISDASTPAITYDGATLSVNLSASQYQWFLDGAAIAGATTSTWTPTANGNYRLRITDQWGCLHWSNTVIVTNVGIDGIENTLVAVYPNPTDGIVTIKSKHASSTVELISADGKVLQRFDATNETLQLDMAQLAKGVYHVRILTAGNVGITKLLKL